MIGPRPAAVLLALLAAPAGAQDAGQPLSAIDWLSRSVEGADGDALAASTEPPVAGDASSPATIASTAAKT